jgi:hypothetical protein
MPAPPPHVPKGPGKKWKIKRTQSSHVKSKKWQGKLRWKERKLDREDMKYTGTSGHALETSQTTPRTKIVVSKVDRSCDNHPQETCFISGMKNEAQPKSGGQ